jgi:hypothetical protein
MLQHLVVTCHFNANTQQPLPGTSVERERKRNVESRCLVPFIATWGAAGLSNQEGAQQTVACGGRRQLLCYRNERNKLHNAGDEEEYHILVQLSFPVMGEGGHRLDWCGLGNVQVAGSWECVHELSDPIKCGEFLDQLRTCWLIKMESAPWH